jgi:hypothetical protein
MNRIGIVLAAGKATRLPGKLLLPQTQGVPVIVSAMTQCPLACQETRVIVAEGSLTEAWVKTTAICGERLRIVSQPDLEIMDRLEDISAKGFDEVLLTFGDNIYPLGERITLGASVRRYDGPGADQLDGWNPELGEWVDRASKPGLKLAGWICLRASVWPHFCEGIDLVHALNVAKVAPVECSAAGWFDCGTEAAYLAYLEGGK